MGVCLTCSFLCCLAFEIIILNKSIVVSLNMLTWDRLAEGIGKCKFGNGNIKDKVIAK